MNTTEFETLSRYPHQLSRLCWMYLIVNISYILAAPWILDQFTSHILSSQLISVLGIGLSGCGVYLTPRVRHPYFLRLLIVIACLVLSAYVVLIPSLFLYFLPLLITPIFLSCIRLSTKDFYFGAASVTVSLSLLWVYAYLYHGFSPPFSPILLTYIFCLTLGMSLSFWIIYTDCLQTTLESLSHTHLKLSREQKRMRRSHQAKATFLNHLGHELSFPLNFITYQRTSLQLLIAHYLEVKDVSPQLKETYYEMNSDLSKIQQSCDALNGLLDDLLNISEESSQNIRINVSHKPLGELLRYLDEAIQSRTSGKINAIHHSIDVEQLVSLDHERSLKLFCVLVKYIYKCIPQAELSLHVSMNDQQSIIFEMRDYYVNVSRVFNLNHAESLPLIDTPTLSLPQAEPSVVLSQRLIHTLNAEIQFSKPSVDPSYKTRFILTLPQFNL